MLTILLVTLQSFSFAVNGVFWVTGIVGGGNVLRIIFTNAQYRSVSICQDGSDDANVLHDERIAHSSGDVIKPQGGLFVEYVIKRPFTGYVSFLAWVGDNRLFKIIVKNDEIEAEEVDPDGVLE